jgi:spore coat polysaccharide biosynthesis predicted glycosyltransferase SpsG
MRLPAVLIDLAKNQTHIAQEFARLGIATHPGSSRDVMPFQIAVEVDSLLASADRRRNMSTNARLLVDGEGAQRVVDELHR